MLSACDGAVLGAYHAGSHVCDSALYIITSMCTMLRGHKLKSKEPAAHLCALPPPNPSPLPLPPTPPAQLL